ncbi:MAG: DUF2652 domain-containing protein [Candidatus Limnocylindrales bacterium]
MTIGLNRGTKVKGTLLLADISGYTKLLTEVADAHQLLMVEGDEPPYAYGLVSSLLDAMVAVVSPPFRLVKFEGDALFAVADDPNAALRGSALLARLRACHAAFQTLLGEASETWTCTCSSCAGINRLSLKFVIHEGDYVLQRIAGREELAGPDVIVAHRLLKNHVRDLLGPQPYALLTDAAVRALEVPVDGMIATTEAYDDLPSVAVHVLALG